VNETAEFLLQKMSQIDIHSEFKLFMVRNV